MEGLTESTWKYTRLGDLLDEVDTRVRDVSADEAKNLEVLSLTKNWGLIPQSERFDKRVATEDISKYKIVQPGWIVYNPYVIWEGAVHALRRTEPGVVSPVYPTFKRIEDDGGYLDFILRTDKLITAYNQLSSGAVNRRRSIKKEDFLAIKIDLPPLNEQRVIAQVLRTAQLAKETTEKVIEAAKQLKQSLMQHLFTYGPVPFREADKVELQESEIGSIPSHWEISNLGNLIEKPKYGLTASAALEQVGPKFLRITDIQDGTVTWESVPYCKCDKSDFEKCRLKSDDIMVARIGATTGKTFFVKNPPVAVFASYLICIRAKENVSSGYLYHYTKSDIYWRQINAAKGGRLKGGVNIPVLKNLIVPLPPKDDQRQIITMLAASDEKLANLHKRALTLSAMLSSLVQNLTTGKIRVNTLDLPELKESA
jgi:type I restriction enzyme S subunit